MQKTGLNLVGIILNVTRKCSKQKNLKAEQSERDKKSPHRRAFFAEVRNFYFHASSIS